MLNVREYVSPYAEQIEEQVEEDLDCIVDEIVAQYTTQQEEEEEEEEEGEEGEGVKEVALVTRQEGLLAIDTLRQYEEQTNGDIELLKLLRKRDRELFSSQSNSKRQLQLHSWLQRG
jgi:hypothetical protein